jgi:hypothetical protein
MTPVAHFSGIVATYEGNRFRIEVNGVVEHEGTYSIDEKVAPAQITYTYTKSTRYELNKPRVGIIQHVGHTFKECVAAIDARPPAGFNTEHGSNAVLTIHQTSGAEAGLGIPAFNVSPHTVLSQW